MLITTPKDRVRLFLIEACEGKLIAMQVSGEIHKDAEFWLELARLCEKLKGTDPRRILVDGSIGIPK